MNGLTGIGKEQGFNLIELAVVMMIVGLLLGGLITPLSTQQDEARRKATETQLGEIETALLGYVARTGRFPCPATNASGGLASPNTPTTACTTYSGFVPARTLDLDGPVDGNDLLTDQWLNPIRYTLSGAGGGTWSNAITLADTPDIQVCEEAACTNVLASTAAAVVLSTGSDGITTASADQLENFDGDNLFVLREESEAAGAEYNDQLIWVSPNTVAFQLVRAGRVD